MLWKKAESAEAPGVVRVGEFVCSSQLGCMELKLNGPASKVRKVGLNRSKLGKLRMCK